MLCYTIDPGISFGVGCLFSTATLPNTGNVNRPAYAPHQPLQRRLAHAPPFHIQRHSCLVSTNYRFHRYSPLSAKALGDILAKMAASAAIEIRRLNADEPVIVTVSIARALASAPERNWEWRGSSHRVKKMREVPVLDPRHPNTFSPCYRNTMAPMDALRQVGSGDLRTADYETIGTGRRRIETQIRGVKFVRVPLRSEPARRSASGGR